ncbi:hypothetical protein B296_00040203 [Ensete ventricosum]|uniref:RNase H type-1 domain-containing protein n=1 Tax=Ensete ventricosum TaxID=4639 RepID=A0A426X2U7_ENSVE|nr:hypothetical protein B296_00040203 [Ensete ventricosum]
MKFLTSTLPGEVSSDPWESRRCYLATTTIPKRGKETSVPDPREPCKLDTRPELTELILEVPLEKNRLERMVFTDSQLVASQVDGSFEAQEPNIAYYLTKARRPIGMTKYFKISQILCLENSKVNALARLASADTANVLPAIPSLCRSMIIAIEMTTTVARPDWREEILHYKRDADRTLAVLVLISLEVVNKTLLDCNKVIHIL